MFLRRKAKNVQKYNDAKTVTLVWTYGGRNPQSVLRELAETRETFMFSDIVAASTAGMHPNDDINHHGSAVEMAVREMIEGGKIVADFGSVKHDVKFTVLKYGDTDGSK